MVRKSSFMLIAFAVVGRFLLSEAIIIAKGLIIKYASCRSNQADGIYVISQSLNLVSVGFVRKLTKWSFSGLLLSVYISIV